MKNQQKVNSIVIHFEYPVSCLNILPDLSRQIYSVQRFNTIP